MRANIPQTMRCVLLEAYHQDVRDAIGHLAIGQRAVPPVGRGQVLVRIDAAPCNPSDLLLLTGKYGALKTLPSVPGWEGTGTVVASGGGLLARWLVGQRVACALSGDRDGTWSEYFVARADECLPVKAGFPVDQAATLIINPMTVLGLLDLARRHGHRAAVHTAGAGQLGRMLLAAAQRERLPLIHVVRRDAQVQLLRELGAEHVLNMSEEGFPQRLKEAAARLHATAAFEAVAGDLTGVVLNALPPRATVYVYGGLSEQPCGTINPVEIIFHGKTITGFYLGRWLKSSGLLQRIRTARRVQRRMAEGVIRTTIQRRVGLEDIRSGLLQYVDHMTDGKVLIVPSGAPA